jgi:hypothetical protein
MLKTKSEINFEMFWNNSKYDQNTLKIHF